MKMPWLKIGAPHYVTLDSYDFQTKFIWNGWDLEPLLDLLNSPLRNNS